MAEKRSLTDLEHTLLGLAAIDPMSGYDMKKAFASSPLRRYAPSSGGLYPALQRMERLGLLEASIDRTSEIRARRLFSPTPAGLAELDSWLREPVTRDMVMDRMEYVMMRFALMEGRVPAEAIVAFLEQLRDVLASYIHDLESHGAAKRESAGLHQRLALEHGIMVNRTRLEWARTTLAEIRSATMVPETTAVE